MGQRAPAVGSPSESAARSRRPGDADIIDTKLGLRLWRSRASYANYMRRFVATHADDVRKIEECLRRPDIPAAAAVAHKLRGAAGAMALSRLAGIASELEARLKEGGQAAPLVDRLRRTMDSTLAEISDFLTAEAEAEAKPPSSAGAVEQGAGDLRDRQQRLKDLLAALDSDNPDAAEPLVEELAPMLPQDAVDALRRHLADFEFREAEASVRELMGSLDASGE